MYARILENNVDGNVGSIYPRDIRCGSLGQYTGMHDKNGNEIYEGDILYYDDAHHKEYGSCIVKIGEFSDADNNALDYNTYVGIYLQCQKYGSVALTQDIAEYFTIIGNTFDNEDLLKS